MWAYFSYETDPKLACSCGKCENPHGMHFDTMRKMDRLRRLLGVPIRVTSGYRCPDYDKAVGGSGAHTTGQAVDFQLVTDDLSKYWEILGYARGMGFYGVGLNLVGPLSSRFVHLDTIDAGGDFPRPRVWTYAARAPKAKAKAKASSAHGGGWQM